MRPSVLALTLSFAILPAASGAVAEQAMSPEAFERYSTGKTLYYGTGSEAYGIEQYLPGRQVVWAFLGQECRYGHWYAQGNEICFVYENDPGPQCWLFYATANGLRAHFTGDTDSTDLVEVNQSADAMPCPGPQVGV